MKFLAQVGKRSTNQALQRTAPARRYPIVGSNKSILRSATRRKGPLSPP
jgi:hypothetical protein